MTKDFVNKLMKQYKASDGKLPQETNQNHRMVGVIVAWQPHNYRLYCKFSRTRGLPFKGLPLSNHGLSGIVSMVNFGSELLWKGVCGCDVRIKRSLVEVTNHFHAKQWRRIVAGSLLEVDARVDSVMDELREQSLRALRSVLSVVGGWSDFVVLKERVEHGVKGEDFLDKIPSDLIIDDSVFKKVYADKTEFKSAAALKCFIKNRALEDFAPVIVRELSLLRRGVFSYPDVVLRSVSSVGEIVDFDVSCWSESDRLLLTDGLFKKFGGV